MTRDRVVRTAMWLSVLLSLSALYVFIPVALGHPSDLFPMDVPPFFAGQAAFSIGLFGIVFAWLALQPVMNRPLVLVGALGKLGWFSVALAFALADVVPMGMAWNAIPDLVLGAVLLWWALGLGQDAAGQAPSRS